MNSFFDLFIRQEKERFSQYDWLGNQAAHALLGLITVGLLMAAQLPVLLGVAGWTAKECADVYINRERGRMVRDSAADCVFGYFPGMAWLMAYEVNDLNLLVSVTICAAGWILGASYVRELLAL